MLAGPERGATFTITLPGVLAPQAAAAAADRHADEEALVGSG